LHEPAHVAVFAPREPILEISSESGRRWFGNAERVEAFSTRALLERR
jgi:hypothetical protein